MPFPEITGHSDLLPGGWDWKKKPAESGAEAGFDVLAAQVEVRFGSSMPAVFAKGRKFAASELPGLDWVPKGDFYCDGLRFLDGSQVGHGVATVRWYGIAPGEGLTLEQARLQVIGAADGAIYKVLDIEEERSTQTIELPQDGVWADGVFLPGGVPEGNPATGDKQRTRLHIPTYSLRFSGVAIGKPGGVMPAKFRTTTPAPGDPDGSLITLDGATASTGAKIIRVAQWWPDVALDGTGWRLESVPSQTFKALGGTVLKTFAAVFKFTRRMEF